MGVSWTREQQQVIDLRKRNILVSAAAGSGKTAVLVERIIKMITEGEHPVDIDRLLVVTFTNAAAAEMRERIGAAIEKALEEHPEADDRAEGDGQGDGGTARRALQRYCDSAPQPKRVCRFVCRRVERGGNTGAYGVSNRLFLGGGGADGACDASDS